MESNLLIRENNLYKLNEQLELKAQELFKEANNLRTQDPPNDVTESLSLSVYYNDQPSSNDSSPSGTERRTGIKSKSPALDDDLPGSVSRPMEHRNGHETEGEPGIGRQTALHIAQAKCKMLEKENECMKSEMKKRAEKLKKSQEELEKVRECQTKCQKQAEASQKMVHKQQDQLEELAEKNCTRETENKSLRKDIDSLNRQLKKNTQESSNNTLRLNRCMEEMDKMKSAAKKAINEIEELKESNRQENEQLTSAIHCLEKQKSELMAGIKKQIQLIDNLKQQMMYLVTTKFVKYAEEEFSRCLDSKMEENASNAATHKL